MPRATLTDISIRSLKAPEKGQVTYLDDNLSGFGVRVSQGGAKTFVLVHGVNRQRLTIGRYPTLSLKAARGEAKRLQAEITLGVIRRTTVTFKEARELFLAACEQKNRPRTVKDYRQRLDRHFRFGKKRLDDIKRAEIQSRLAKLRATPSEQNHAFVALRTFFNWALREQFVDASPMAGMRAPSVLPARDRVLSDRELAEVCRVARGHPYPFGPIVALLILTGQRRGEIAALEWDWIDEDERRITLPASLTKNKHTHVFPYGNTVDEMLRGLPRVGKYLFPSRVETGTVFNGWGKSKARFDKGLSNVEPYTLHDIRRTFSSTHAGLGTPIHVTEKLLNHISGTVSGVAAIYNRHSYMAEMRAAIATYEAHLAKLVGKC